MRHIYNGFESKCIKSIFDHKIYKYLITFGELGLHTVDLLSVIMLVYVNLDI